MKFTATEIPDVLLIEPDVYQDERGFFLETWHIEKYAEAGISLPFRQDAHSLSQRGTLRGLHAQLTKQQGKLIRVIAGEIFDVAADIREGSPTFGKWAGVRLSADNFKQLYLPPGLAHGFCVISERAQVEYKITEVYHPEDELGIIWDDPDLAIDWPVKEPLLSARDKKHPRLSAMRGKLPTYTK
ncbi:MAG: dTDP-4-dehydrorhamnose 3,5-epimerase [Elusimicrobiota bacterium]